MSNSWHFDWFLFPGNRNNESSFCNSSSRGIIAEESSVGNGVIGSGPAGLVNGTTTTTTGTVKMSTAKIHVPSERRFTGTPLRIPLQRSCSSPAGTFGKKFEREERTIN